ncbi:MFS multidrug transporter, putative [Cordyceps militaris CM01]|uniref:MFS multidrug transporter, putative n=1 Tax=Cordyceps militaris (strain CM01) TaxID=983644 RepID=G3J8J9_CORMM|nr:MFS multidrug transporter, putative [Cordyceps militaris CM01]EGX94786.1 MFS multidrug transporter, putative [Cordyceps militaris CM01]
MAISAAPSAPTEADPLLRSRSHDGVDRDFSSRRSASENEDCGSEEMGHVRKDLGNRTYVLLPSVAIGLLLAAMDQLITLAAYAKIGNDLNAMNSMTSSAMLTVDDVYSYFLTLTSCQPLYGKLSDIFGRKVCLLFAYAIFGIGCLGCGLSQSLLQLCIARGIAGIGGGGITALVSILISVTVPLRDRGIWQGYIDMIFATGTLAGAPLGGILADSIGWRWSFIGQAPMCLLAGLALHFLLPMPPSSPSSRHELLSKMKSIDFSGALTLVSSILALLLGLDSGSNVGWTQPQTLIPLAITPLLVAAFIYNEVHVASYPFAPGHIIFNPSMFACYMANFFGVASQMGAFFFLPLFFQAVQGFSAALSGTLLMQGMAFGVLSSIGSGWVIKKTGKFYWINVSAFGLAFLSTPLLALGFWRKSVVLQVLAFIASSIGVYAVLIALLANTTMADTAVTVACSYMFRSLGASVGVSTSSALLQYVLRTELGHRLSHDKGLVDEIGQRVRQNIDYIKELPPIVAAIVRSSYQHASVIALAPPVLCGLLAFIFTFWVREAALRNK